MKKKKKIVRYELLAIFMFLSISVGLFFYFYKKDAGTLNSEGVALDVSFSIKKEEKGSLRLYLQSSDKDETDIYRETKVKSFQVKKLFLTKKKTSLRLLTPHGDFVLIKDIDMNKKSRCIVKSKAAYKKEKFGVITTYYYDPKINFKEFESTEKQDLTN